MDAALYELGPPKVTTLYGVSIPQGPRQNCRYDDGTGDTLDVPLAATAYVSGRTMFEILPKELKSLAVRSTIKYAPHPFVWMASAGAIPTALGLESDGREVPLDQLPPWDESLRKTYPMLWKNPVTGGLHLMAHGCGAMEIFVQPLPEGVDKTGALYPDGATITDLKEVRKILYTMQRPAIAPSLVYPHEWRPNDLVLWHNRGVMHTAVGILSEDQHRVCHQCTLASADDPIGPSSEDVEKWV
ncbi:hypothetical protein DL96DRAFT_1621836 [Flagelloscypha sp. PMI_526]|nr:hypothetical protein DL96DRAFT_1621836 [Flagelloscypha sp. PMI_526]